MSTRDPRSRFAGDLDEATGVRPEDQVDAGTCACGCGGPGCWDPDQYVTYRRPSQALADHLDAVVALVAAAGGAGVHPVGPAARGDDVVGDELVLCAWFDVPPGPVELNELVEQLEDQLDVGVRLTPVAPVRRGHHLVLVPDPE